MRCRRKLFWEKRGYHVDVVLAVELAVDKLVSVCVRTVFPLTGDNGDVGHSPAQIAYFPQVGDIGDVGFTDSLTQIAAYWRREMWRVTVQRRLFPTHWGHWAMWGHGLSCTDCRRGRTLKK